MMPEVSGSSAMLVTFLPALAAFACGVITVFVAPTKRLMSDLVAGVSLLLIWGGAVIYAVLVASHIEPGLGLARLSGTCVLVALHFAACVLVHNFCYGLRRRQREHYVIATWLQALSCFAHPYEAGRPSRGGPFLCLKPLALIYNECQV